MTDLIEEIILKHLQDVHKPQTVESATAEAERIDEMNSLTLDEFLELPKEDQEVAEDVWTAKVLEANVRRQEERRQRIVQEQIEFSKCC
jgi:hypothetical protein